MEGARAALGKKRNKTKVEALTKRAEDAEGADGIPDQAHADHGDDTARDHLAVSLDGSSSGSTAGANLPSQCRFSINGY